MRTLIIIPAYNEEKNIGKIVGEVKGLFPKMPVLVIDDSSDDLTPYIAKDAGATVCSFFFNQGYGKALRRGFEFAVDHKYDYVITMDADGQHDPGSVGPLLEEIQKNEADIIIGSRFLGSGYRYALLKRIGRAVFRMLIYSLTRLKISDPASGYQALGRRAIECYAGFESDYFDMDAIVFAHHKGLRIKEIPVIICSSKKTMHGGVLRPLLYFAEMLISIFEIVGNKED